jgi:hypothetical protein
MGNSFLFIDPMYSPVSSSRILCTIYFDKFQSPINNRTIEKDGRDSRKLRLRLQKRSTDNNN